MRKHGLKALGLALLAALGLMAFAASAAQAENLDVIMTPGSGVSGVFLSGGTTFPIGLNQEPVTGTQIGSIVLEVPAKSAEIVCQQGTATGFIQNEYEDYLAGAMKAGGHGHATLLFLECSVNSINAAGALTGELKKCTEELNKNNPEGHITVDVLVLVKLHNNKPLVIFEPLIASRADDEAVAALTKPFNLTLITFGGTCSLPASVNIFGGVAILAPETDTAEPTLKINTLAEPDKADQTLMGAQLLFGASPAFIKAEGKVKLTNHPTLAWGAM